MSRRGHQGYTPIGGYRPDRRQVMYVLVYDGHAQYVSPLMERLSEAMASYTEVQQKQMSIQTVEVLT